MRDHNLIVSKITRQVKDKAAAKTKVKIAKASVSHFVPNPKDTNKVPKIDLSPLIRILEIDANAKTCTAESGVTFEALVKETLKHGLIPVTVPELKTITVGGAVSGCSVESMSFRYGGFHDSSTEYELITGTGEVIACSPEKNADIFHMLHGSYGTLGIITKVKFRLLPAKPFVRMTYRKFRTFAEFWQELEGHCNRADHDFIDAIIHSKDAFVICLGDMVGEAPYTSSYDWLKIFYKSTNERTEDYLTTYDYFFRYDTECHWLTRTAPLLETWPARLLLGKMLLGSTNLIKWSNRLKPVMRLKKRPDVVVDVFIPSNRFGDFYSWYERDFDFYPLWIVPYRAPHLYPWINRDYGKKINGTFFIDCAVYGKKNSKPDVDYSEIIEKKTIEMGGIKTLISRNHFDEKKFWTIYDKENYRNAKKKTDPAGLFFDLYKKFSSER